MFYYLDSTDGYSKGPYTWEELKRLPLPPETHIYHSERQDWHTLAHYQTHVAAEARAAGIPAHRPGYSDAAPKPKAPKKQPAQPNTHKEPAAPQSPVYPSGPQQNPAPARQWIPAPATTQPMQPPLTGNNPMGISGIGCFVMALLFALLIIGVIVLLM